MHVVLKYKTQSCYVIFSKIKENLSDMSTRQALFPKSNNWIQEVNINIQLQTNLGAFKVKAQVKRLKNQTHESRNNVLRHIVKKQLSFGSMFTSLETNMKETKII